MLSSESWKPLAALLRWLSSEEASLSIEPQCASTHTQWKKESGPIKWVGHLNYGYYSLDSAREGTYRQRREREREREWNSGNGPLMKLAASWSIGSRPVATIIGPSHANFQLHNKRQTIPDYRGVKGEREIQTLWWDWLAGLAKYEGIYKTIVPVSGAVVAKLAVSNYIRFLWVLNVDQRTAT